ncbi:MAG: error-prone DNA polymerase [Planctomycetaceae bacterium]
MPDLPPRKRRPLATAPTPVGARPDAPVPASPPEIDTPAPRSLYAELHCKSNFSFLEGASHPDELVARAVELGYSALAITDRNTLAGVVRMHAAAKPAGLKLLVGAEIWLRDAPPLVLLAQDRAGYAHLARLITRGRRSAPKGECHLHFDDLAQHAPGLLAGVLPQVAGWTGAAASPLRRAAGDTVAAPPDPTRWLSRYRELFGDRTYLYVDRHLSPDDDRRVARLQRWGDQAGVPLVATNDVHYHVAERRFLQDVVTAIRLGQPVASLGDRLFPNAERHLKSPAQMTGLFWQNPDLVLRTQDIVERCRFSLDELRYEYPEELSPAGQTPGDFLQQLAWEGAHTRYPEGIPTRVSELLRHELTLIADLKYEAYFLTVWDLVRFARSRGILCQGRGSAANSVVCFCLGITSVDPERIDVLFERFVSRERNEAPDIDVDFEHERREEVIQYVYEKYGRERAGMTAALISYRPRSAVRDVGKALGLSLDRVDLLAKTLEHRHDAETLRQRFREAGLNPQARTARQLQTLVDQLLGVPRHLSQHVGGLVITRGPLCELTPIENAAMPGRTVIEWDKDDLDTLGILKVDCLSLGMLTALHRCFDLVERSQGKSLTLANIPREDPRVYDMISQADTMGVFQIESRAQMAMLPRLRPRCFYDLVIEVAIVRPGPIQGDMVHPYLRRRAGEEPVEFPDERIRDVLQKTMGVPIFQEQAMRLAVVAAGFTPGEADQLRRAMGAWRRPGVIDQFHRKLVDGMAANGYSTDFADRVFRQIRGFGEYGFPESHAASFALLVYISAWLKRHQPAAFTAALLNSQPMGFYGAAQLVADARRHGVAILPVDVNHSDWDCTLEPVTPSPPSATVPVPGGTPAPGNPSPVTSPWGIRLGLRQVSGLRAEQGRQIATVRGTQPFQSVEELGQRVALPPAVLARLARANALGSLAESRRQALWQVLRRPEQKTLFAHLEDPEPRPHLRPLSPLDEVVADYRTAGLSLRDHPLRFFRDRLSSLRVVRAGDLPRQRDGARLKVAGLVLMRQRPGTASGITFVTLEDETGFINLIVRPDIWERFHKPARTAQALLAWGVLQKKHETIHVLVDRLEDLAAIPQGATPGSRDFH